MLTTAFLFADNGEWGKLFREGLEKYRNAAIEPEDKEINIKKWKNGKDWMIENYKTYLKRDDNSDKNQTTDAERRNGIISSYYYYATDPEIDEIVNFFIYVIENEKNQDIILGAIKNLTTIAFEGNTKAENYISKKAKSSSLSHKIRLQFNLSNIKVREDQQSINYLIGLIKKAQDVETTDLKFKSPDESTIVWYLIRKLFPKRYYSGKEYDYAVPLVKEMILSKSKIVQRFAISSYYKHTNKTEMRSIYQDCWDKVQNETTPRDEYINALYGLQALYELRDIGKHSMEFKGILTYFATLGGKKPIKNGFEYIELTDESRISKTEKQYFQKRLRSK